MLYGAVLTLKLKLWKGQASQYFCLSNTPKGFSIYRQKMETIMKVIFSASLNVLSHCCCGQATCQQQVCESQGVPREEKATLTWGAAAREQLHGGRNPTSATLPWNVESRSQTKQLCLWDGTFQPLCRWNPRICRCAGTTENPWESQGTAAVCLGGAQLVSHPSTGLLEDTFTSGVVPSPRHISELSLSSALSVALCHLISLIIDIVLCKSSRIPNTTIKS